jgi:hypothetical protein
MMLLSEPTTKKTARAKGKIRCQEILDMCLTSEDAFAGDGMRLSP